MPKNAAITATVKRLRIKSMSMPTSPPSFRPSFRSLDRGAQPLQIGDERVHLGFSAKLGRGRLDLLLRIRNTQAPQRHELRLDARGVGGRLLEPGIAGHVG